MRKKRVAVVIAQNFEDSEVIDPIAAIEAAGGETVLIGIELGDVTGKKGATLSGRHHVRCSLDSDAIDTVRSHAGYPWGRCPGEPAYRRLRRGVHQERSSNRANPLPRSVMVRNC